MKNIKLKKKELFFLNAYSSSMFHSAECLLELQNGICCWNPEKLDVSLFDSLENSIWDK